MPVIYSEEWYAALALMINGSRAFAAKAPTGRMVMAIEVVGDDLSPYVSNGDALYYRLSLEEGEVVELVPLSERPGSDGLQFRFTAPAETWEQIAAGLLDPITAGLRGQIRIRGDMRFLMQNADAVKVLVDLYATGGDTEWPRGKPPYGLE